MSCFVEIDAHRWAFEERAVVRVSLGGCHYRIRLRMVSCHCGESRLEHNLLVVKSWLYEICLAGCAQTGEG